MFRFSASHHFVLERASLSRLLNYYVEITYTVTSRFPVAAFVLDDTVVCLSIVSWRVFGTTLDSSFADASVPVSRESYKY